MRNMSRLKTFGMALVFPASQSLNTQLPVPTDKLKKSISVDDALTLKTDKL